MDSCLTIQALTHVLAFATFYRRARVNIQPSEATFYSCLLSMRCSNPHPSSKSSSKAPLSNYWQTSSRSRISAKVTNWSNCARQRSWWLINSQKTANFSTYTTTTLSRSFCQQLPTRLTRRSLRYDSMPLKLSQTMSRSSCAKRRSTSLWRIQLQLNC